ncbi:hypothetical protein FHR22_001057 [Sphingopyxis panaciterrae]|uniref:hypothetical protein n=1 Tax=Sphingopyxis panaciterrae TaxID=363841 RepID=UPI0014223C3D|nr:hypothetical protein [Sphingopyxis panaciterrae]NIJ36408.1 hypothetical protein [Sphingopyxis panaciterrae]
MNYLAITRPISSLRLFFIFLIAIFAWSIFFPALNWPDEVYKISQVGIDSNIYLELMSRLSTNYCIVNYVYTSDGSYLSNQFFFRMTSDGGCYYTLKYINAGFVVILAAICLSLLWKKPYLRNLFALSLIWPAQIFYTTGVNQQAFFSIVSMFIIVSVIGSSFIIPYVALAGVMIFVDRSFVSLFIFLGALIAMRWKPRLALPVFILVSIAALVGRPYIEGLEVLFGSGQTVGDISGSLENYYDSPILSLGLFLISFVYLGGTNSILGIGIDYILVLGTILVRAFKKRKNADMMAYFLSFIFTYFIVILFVPTIQTFRYYVFIVPLVLHFLVETEGDTKKYVAYCVAMNVIYLIQARIIYA